MTRNHRDPDDPVGGLEDADCDRQDDGLFTVPKSHLERRLATPLSTAAAHAALRTGTNSQLGHHRPGEGPPTQPEGPIDWHQMTSDTYEETWGALVDFLTWALPHWGFTTEQIPTQCWWHHPEIVEELTAWWGLWQACVRNPAANITDQTGFQERTYALKQRLEYAYRGRCRHTHQPPAALRLSVPDVAPVG